MTKRLKFKKLVALVFLSSLICGIYRKVNKNASNVLFRITIPDESISFMFANTKMQM